MEKATTIAAVKCMTDKEKKTFVSKQIKNFEGFTYDDDKTLIKFKNEGRTIYVLVALYSERLSFDITHEDFKRVYILQDLTAEDSNNKLWYYRDMLDWTPLREICTIV